MIRKHSQSSGGETGQETGLQRLAETGENEQTHGAVIEAMAATRQLPYGSDYGPHIPLVVEQQIKSAAVGDPFMEKILIRAANCQLFRDASAHQVARFPRSTEHDGVTLFLVGSNASHEFYLGKKDGKYYRASLGEEFPDDEGPSTIEWHMREVAPDELETIYLGSI